MASVPEASGCGGAWGTGAPVGYREFPHGMNWQATLAYYMPPHLPLTPVITTNTHAITNRSWLMIKNHSYDDSEAKEGKVNGSSYFYKQFFRILFEQCPDLRRIFPEVYIQATVMSKVIAFCLSIDYYLLDLQIEQIRELGRKHQTIIRDAWHLSIYVTNLLATFRVCLGEHATEEVMSAWANVMRLVLMHMIPETLTPQHIRVHACATNAVTAVDEADQRRIVEDRKFSERRTDMLAEERASQLRRAQGQGAGHGTAAPGSRIGAPGYPGEVGTVSAVRVAEDADQPELSAWTPSAVTHTLAVRRGPGAPAVPTVGPRAAGFAQLCAALAAAVPQLPVSARLLMAHYVGPHVSS